MTMRPYKSHGQYDDYEGDSHDRQRAAKRDITPHEKTQPCDLELKEAMSKDLLLFLNTCLHDRLTAEFSTSHLKMIENAQTVIMHGGKSAIAMPRASGKTTILTGALLWAIMCGHRKFVVIVAADTASSINIINNIKATLECCPELDKFYPEATYYIKAMDGIAQRAGSQTCDGALTRMVYKKEKIKFPSHVNNDPIHFENTFGAIIEARGITGRIRGMSDTVYNKQIRPDLVLLDDVQTSESASSPKQCEQRLNNIFKDVHGLSGFSKEITIFSLMTVIEEGDVADVLLSKWSAVRVSMVEKWPSRELLDQYVNIRTGAIIENTNKHDEFYLQHQKTFQRDMSVYWNARFNENESDALQHALNLYADIGHKAFYAEYQNKPQRMDENFSPVTTFKINKKIGILKTGELPKDAHILTCGIDVNHYGLTWVVSATTFIGETFVIDFGIFPGGNKNLWWQDSPTSLQNAIHSGLETLTSLLLEKYPTMNIITPDGNYETDVVYNWVKQTSPSIKCRIVPIRGQASKQFKFPRSEIIRQMGSHCYVKKTDRGDTINIESNWWIYKTQQGFCQAHGTKGGIQLPSDFKSPEFCHQISSEKLASVTRTGEYTVYSHNKAPGDKNDYLDSLKYTLAAATLLGAGDLPKIDRRPKMKGVITRNIKHYEL